MRRYCIALMCIIYAHCIYAQQEVSFYSSDSLKITADLYLKGINYPFILLFHQGESSRGEYKEIASKLTKLDYNCLAVDLRYGDKINYTVNKTALLAERGSFDRSMMDASKDIQAAVEYIKKYNRKSAILFGSSYSASLCLLEAASNKSIKAVIAMSPGEYFRPDIVLKERLTDISQQLFISATALEYDFIMEMFDNTPKPNIHFFQPSVGRGDHGAKMLWESSESADQCWLELLLFFRKIRY